MTYRFSIFCFLIALLSTAWGGPPISGGGDFTRGGGRTTGTGGPLMQFAQTWDDVDPLDRRGARLQAVVDAAAPGSTIQLENRTYYFRSRLILRKPVRILGHPLGTKIVGGFGVPMEKIAYLKDRPSDPWFSRFPASVRDRIRVLDFNKDLGTPDTGFIGGWDPNVSNINNRSPEDWLNPITATVDDFALNFAESKVPGKPGPAYVNVSAPDPADPNSFFTTDAMPWPRWASPQDIADNRRDVRVTAFASQDYEPIQTGIEELNESTGRVTLRGQNLFAIPGKTTQWNMNQRFKLWNAPEFLKEDGQMVVNTALKRLYFLSSIPGETSSGDEEFNGAGEGRMLYISQPGTQFRSTAPVLALIQAETSGVDIRGISFLAAYNTVFRAFRQSDLTFENCKFVGVGFMAFNTNACSNVRIANCLFGDSYRYHMLIIDDRPSGLYSGLPPVYGPLVSSNYTITRSRFEKAGRIWKSAISVRLADYCIGVTIDRCSFRDLPARAIGIVGAGNKVHNTVFERVLSDVTDAAVVALGRSLVQLGNEVVKCVFRDIIRYSDTEISDSTACIMLDDYFAGQYVAYTYFENTDMVFKMNGGRYHLFKHNRYKNVGQIIRIQTWGAVESSWREFVELANANNLDFRGNNWAGFAGKHAYQDYDPQRVWAINDLQEMANRIKAVLPEGATQIPDTMTHWQGFEAMGWLTRHRQQPNSFQPKLKTHGIVFIYDDSDYIDGPHKNIFTFENLVNFPGGFRTPWGTATAYNFWTFLASDRGYDADDQSGIKAYRVPYEATRSRR